MPIGWAIAGSAVLGAATSYVGGQQQASAARSAASQQQQAAEEQLGLTGQMYTAGGALSLPTRELGGEAQSELAYLFGMPGIDIAPDFSTPSINPNGSGGTSLTWQGPSTGYGWNSTTGGSPVAPGTPGSNQGGAGVGQYSPASPGTSPSGSLGFGSLLNPYNPSTFFLSPDYNFIQQQTQLAAQRAGAATGQVGSRGPSGAQYESLMNYANGLASTDFNQAFQNSMAYQGQVYNELSGVAGQGTSATNALIGAGTNAAATGGAAIAGYGNAGAAGTVGAANALTSSYNGIASSLAGGVNSYVGLTSNPYSPYNPNSPYYNTPPAYGSGGPSPYGGVTPGYSPSNGQYIDPTTGYITQGPMPVTS